MDSRPIGVFDSGVGGLTVLHECLVTMPNEDFVYLGDHARLPYGPRPLAEVRRFAAEIAGYLGGDTAFEHAIGEFADAYADQTERDHAAFVAAIKAGRVTAEPGV